MMATLISVNVGLPREIPWQGKIVRTAIWKSPVSTRVFAGRLNLSGDGQADLAGHGGEQRAVMVYQLGSYRHWQEHLGRPEMEAGSFGENFTVEGLPDDEVCIGDLYRIGTALFEVTQPRVTCYRVAIRLNHPPMPALLTASGRPGFYFRVIEEGEVGAGDSIVLVKKGPQSMTIAVINALLYSSHHPRDQLERALKIQALSPGWQWSFEELMRSQDAGGVSGNAGLTPAVALRGPTPGFRPLRVIGIETECANVLSLTLRPIDGRPLTVPLPGQYVVLRLNSLPEGGQLFRSYSLSGAPSTELYRISVKLDPEGAAGIYFSMSLQADDVLEVSEPRGGFTLKSGARPVVLMSAGIGATPVLAMLHALAASASAREVWWLHGTRDGTTHAFAGEVRLLIGQLAGGRSHIWYSRPAATDGVGRNHDSPGRLEVAMFDRLGVPRDSDFYLCGPPGFLAELNASLATWGVPRDRTYSEVFAGGSASAPGQTVSRRSPHPPDGPKGTGPLVAFTRSGLAVRWRTGDTSLLGLAEACDVPVRWSCRAGVCHNCESGLVSGIVAYEPDPLDPPGDGNVLICCARPLADVAVDL